LSKRPQGASRPKGGKDHAHEAAGPHNGVAGEQRRKHSSFRRAAKFTGKGKGSAPEIIAGTNQWTGGTGKFTGIQRNNTFRVTAIGKTLASSIVWEGEWQLP